MGTVNSEGFFVYDGTENIAPHAAYMNLQTSALTAWSNGKVMPKKVDNIAARTAYVNAVGVPNISAANPILVWRADAAAGSQLEYTTNGTTWEVFVTSEYLAAQDTGWVDIPLTSPWANYGSPFATCQVRRVGNIFYTKGLARCSSAVTTGSIIGTLPTGFRPTETRMFAGPLGFGTWTTSTASTGTAHTHTIPTTGMSARLTVNVSGVLSLEASTSLNLSANSYMTIEGTWMN